MSATFWKIYDVSLPLGPYPTLAYQIANEYDASNLRNRVKYAMVE